jgi:hypothetical protein
LRNFKITNNFTSDGAGRSGVYLAIDANIELSEEDGVFDVFGYLKKMRQQRRGLVEAVVRLKTFHSPIQIESSCRYLAVWVVERSFFPLP